jgi:hypothetical protein
MAASELAGAPTPQAPWRVEQIRRCGVVVTRDTDGQLAVTFLLPDGNAIEVLMSDEGAEAVGKALLAPRVHMP